MGEINGREYFIDEQGYPCWADGAKKRVPPIAWELHVKASRQVKILGQEGDQLIGKSTQPMDAEPILKNPHKAIRQGDFK